MTVAWMLYALVITGLLFAAAIAAEFVCRALRLQTRFIWCAALCLATGLPATSLFRDPPLSPAVSPLVEISHAPSFGAVDNAPVLPARPARSLSTVERLPMSARAVLDDFRRPSTALAAVVPMTTFAALIYLIVAVARVRRVARRLEPRELDGYRVLVSNDLGPALIGVIRSRIVVPRWLLSLCGSERRVILAHEQEHADAFDPAMLAGAVVLLALQPWNLALWAIVARLRLAIEADCDRRVLGPHGDARGYGDLLIRVYERTTPGRLPLVAFVERQSNLERRIRRIVGRTPSMVSARGIGALLASVILAAVACETTAPTKSARDSLASSATDQKAEPSVSIVGVQPPCMRSNWAVETTAPNSKTLRASARERHPAVFTGNSKNEVAIVFELDENCAIKRDTVLEFPAGTRTKDSFFWTVFGDTSGPAQNRGGMTSEKIGGRYVNIWFTVRPTREWAIRSKRSPCGFGLRFDETCGLPGGGPLVLRMMDSVRAVIGVRRFGAANQPVDELFLVTLLRPYPGMASQAWEHGVVAYQSGALYIENSLALHPRWLFAPRTSNGLTLWRRLPDVELIDDLIGVAHYKGSPLTLEQIDQLRPATKCDGPPGACYVVGSHSIEFPG